MAWVLAALPPALSALDRVPDALGAPLWAQAATLCAGGLGYAILLRRDSRAVAAACRDMRRGFLDLVVPVYLARRAAATGTGGAAAPAWCVAVALSLAVSPVRLRHGAPGALPACDAPEILAVMPGYVGRDGGVPVDAVDASAEVARPSASERRCVALFRSGGGRAAYVFTLALSGADVEMSGIVEAVPNR